ncbi:MAG: metal-dependent hydrolase [Mesorhizobium sp.]|uniref:metal-dependent hydrolase n=1 Tax=Mesorhizobium sp. TaxID=1871066 RepID=UPI000FE97117|nr:metal-dependent hydrolase [Mesorhizobium sp.]RWI15458.1 MAG: metal-dependent hydrolase [Mesorhizobium sp.]
MLIAHLPSGYILGRLARRRRREASDVVAAAMLGSVIPDIDMLYFYLIDGGRTHHHAYITHWPLFWATIGTVGVSVGRLLGSRRLPSIAIFLAGAMVHMALDTVASPIMWLAPFSHRPFELVAVPASHGNWVLNFVLHWTFALELVICAWGLGLGWLRSALPTDASQKGS